MDNAVRRFCEIEFFSKEFTVANPVFDLYNKLVGQNIFPNQLLKLPDMEKSLQKSKIEGSVGENYYNIIKKKQNGKENSERIFKVIK